MTKMDHNTHDIQIQIDADKRKGVWANLTYGTTSKPLRNAGQLPTTASNHTLLVVALTTGLMNISRTQHGRITAKLNGKPRLNVVTRDENFYSALTGIVTLDKKAPPLKAGRNFVSTFFRNLARFAVSVTLDTDPTNLALIGWAQKTVVEAKQVANIPATFAASAVSQLE
jgi:GMP synthase PP-ATPase subunit